MGWLTRSVGIVVGIVLIALGPSTRGLGELLVVVSLVAAFGFEFARRRGSVGPRSVSRTYAASDAQTFNALQVAVEQLRYKTLATDSAARTLSFNTGISPWTWAGQDYAATLHRSNPNSTEVELTGSTARRRLGALQSVSWGETDRLAHRVLDRIQVILARSTE